MTALYKRKYLTGKLALEKYLQTSDKDDLWAKEEITSCFIGGQSKCLATLLFLYLGYGAVSYLHNRERLKVAKLSVGTLEVGLHPQTSPNLEAYGIKNCSEPNTAQVSFCSVCEKSF